MRDGSSSVSAELESLLGHLLGRLGRCGQLALGAEEIAHAPHLRADPAKLLLNPFITAIDVVDAIEDRFAIGDQSGENQRG